MTPAEQIVIILLLFWPPIAGALMYFFLDE